MVIDQETIAAPILALDETEKTLDGLPFVIENGAHRLKGFVVIRVLNPETENYHPRVCDINHIMLWNKALRLWRFFKATQELGEPGIAERWAKVESYVLKGGSLDESVLD